MVEPEVVGVAAPESGVTPEDIEQYRQRAVLWLENPGELEEQLFRDMLVSYQITIAIAHGIFAGAEGARVKLLAMRDAREMADSIIEARQEYRDEEDVEDGPTDRRPGPTVKANRKLARPRGA